MEEIERLDFSKINFGPHGRSIEPLAPGAMERMRADTLNEQEGNLNATDGYDCRLCRNKGFVASVREEGSNYYMTTTPCKCMATRNSIMRMKRSGLESLISKCRFDTFEASEPWQAEIKEKAMAFARHPEGWFYLGGQSGAGKTHLCTAICRDLLLKGKDVLYMLWRDEVARIKALANTEDFSREMRRYKEIEVLYIDDLFKSGRFSGTIDQRPTPADQQIAFELLNYRINNKLVTIISSECSVNDLLDIDEATAGRIVEGSNTFTIGRDRRKNYRLKKVKEL